MSTIEKSLQITWLRLVIWKDFSGICDLEKPILAHPPHRIVLLIGCGSPEWADDQYCDDENNNAGCNWDGGACCNNLDPEWDKYCTDCKCLGPASTTTTLTPTTTTLFVCFFCN